jgi:cytosine/adenosine deaminase-related metal-dependent hydrolase
LYRKFTADHIFTGRQLAPANSVLITTTEGVVIELINKQDAGDDIETFKGLLTPGFINAHCHLELSYLKDAIPTGTGLVQFVQQVMGKSAPVDETKLEGMRTAEQEMYNSGVVAVGDICNTTNTISIKQKSKIYWQNFIEVSGFVDGGATKRLADIKNIYEEFYINNLPQTTLSPHAPYSVSKTLFTQLNTETANQLITIHNQECAAENDLYQQKKGSFLELYKNFGIDIDQFTPTGKTSLQSWLPYFNSNQSIILVHNTFISQADIDFYNEQSKANNDPAIVNPSLFFCLCINANKYIEQKIPPIELLRKNNCPIVIGTDSYASNWQLNIFEEIKTIQHETSFTIPLPEILQWATINGARALQMDHLLGSFEKDKKPGVVLIDGLNDLSVTQHSSAKRIL